MRPTQNEIDALMSGNYFGTWWGKKEKDGKIRL